LFVDAATLRQLVADREQARAVPLPPLHKPTPVTTEIRYLSCPICRGLMNRVNFGRRSGVIVDVCRAHGTWFDAGELVTALEFVAQGGLADSLRRDREDLLEAQRQMRQASVNVNAAATLDLQGKASQLGGLVELFSDIWRALI
jgi:Zn-finger nucleic acid-binding protein